MATVVLSLALATVRPAATARGGPLTEGARLAAVYDTILQARFDNADEELADTCPPAPEGACKALAAAAMWWQIQLNPASRVLDGKFNDRAARAIGVNDAWTRSEPQRAEAWFYLAGSYGPLVQWRVLRGERLVAAREGKKIKDALERALTLDPTLADAHFGIGLYRYYADVVPAALKLVRWLLLLPGGDRVKGLAEMLEARNEGELLTGEADYQLHFLYLWYEHQPNEALDLLEGLEKRYPANPLFLQRIAEVRDDYFHDHPASAEAWQELLNRAVSGRLSASRLAEVRARIGLGLQLDAMFETDRAVDELTAVVRMNPLAPYGARAQAQLQLGAAYDRLGLREQAAVAYKAAQALAPDDDALKIREQARAGLRATPDERAADAYRVSLEGWRALERGAADSAVAMLSRAAALSPSDPVIMYRYARALEVSGDHARAQEALEKVIASRGVPSIVLASAYVDYAAALEHAGDRSRALELYRDATRIVGGDPRARDQAARAIKRLTPASQQRKVF